MTVGSNEARAKLPALIDRVAQGDSIMITRHGVPVARLVPVDCDRSQPTREVIDKLRTFCKGRRLGRLSIRKMIEEGRRF